MSFVFYVVVGALCGWCAYRAEKHNKKKYIWLVIGILTCVAGFRSSTVGWDTLSYLEKFRMIEMGRLDLAYGLEDTFKCIVLLIQNVVSSGQFVLILLAFVTNCAIISLFWELRKISYFTCMVLCYYMSFYFTTMNTVRQYCAVAIVFYSIRFLEKKQILRFIGGVLVAMLFHRTAMVGIIFLAIYCARWDEFSVQQRVWIKRFALCVPVAAILLLLIGFFERYTKYFTNIQLDVGVMLPIKLAFWVFALKSFSKTVKLCEDKNERFALITAGVGYLVAITFGMLGYVFLELDRIGWYFCLYEGVFFGILLKEKEFCRRAIYSCVITVLVLFGFVYSMLRNSQGQMPYKLSADIIDVSNGIAVCGYGLDDNGRIVELADGIVEEDGELYYYENGRRTYAGLIKIKGKYYYVRSNGKLVVDCWYWITKTNGLIPGGRYYFNSDGKLSTIKANPSDQ